MTFLKFSASINPGTRIKINLRRLWKQLMLSFAKKSVEVLGVSNKKYKLADLFKLYESYGREIQR